MHARPWWLIALFLGCTNESDRELDEVCDNVGFAISSRTLACTGDPNLANDRYERFHSSVTCAAQNNADTYFDCVRSVNARSCTDVLALGDDFPRWIATSSTCPVLFGVDGGVP